MSTKSYITFLVVLLINMVFWSVSYIFPSVLQDGITRGEAAICAAIYLVGFALLACHSPRR